MRDSVNFIVDMEKASGEQKTEHRLAVNPREGETDWEALIRVTNELGVNLLRARRAGIPRVRGTQEQDSPVGGVIE